MQPRGWAINVMVIVAAALAGLAAPAHAAPDAASKAALDRLRTHYAGVRTLDVVITTVTRSSSEGKPQETRSASRLAVARPNRLARFQGDDQSRALTVCDGTSLWQLSVPDNVYTKRPAPATFADVMDRMLDVGGTPGPKGHAWDQIRREAALSMVFATPDCLTLALLDGKRFDDACAAAESIEHAGREEIDGLSCDRLIVRDFMGRTDLWVAAEGPAWVVRLAPLMEIGREAPTLVESSPVMTLSQWSTAPPPAERFTFTPPPGARQTETLMKPWDRRRKEQADLDAKVPPRPLGTPPSPNLTFEEAWSAPGRWLGFTSDAATGETCAIEGGPAGAIVRFDRAGKELARFNLEERELCIRFARLSPVNAPQVILYGRWGRKVSAYDAKGHLLWVYDAGHGVDSVWTGPLGADKDLDSVAIGYNGAGGVHVLDAAGALLWKDTSLGNVWHIDGGRPADNSSPQTPEIYAPGINGVQVFGPDGTRIDLLKTGIDPYMVRLARSAKDNKSVIITSAATPPSFTATFRDGTRAWKCSVPDAHRQVNHVMDAASAPGKPWFAAAINGGLLVVLDTRTGDRILTMQTPGSCVSWIPREGGASPLLLVQTDKGLRAGVLRESEPVAIDPGAAGAGGPGGGGAVGGTPTSPPPPTTPYADWKLAE